MFDSLVRIVGFNHRAMMRTGIAGASSIGRGFGYGVTTPGF